MNNYEQFASKKKNQTLLLVEGKHEKEDMLRMMLSAFPEIPISMENIHVFSADIYDLYQEIEEEYEENWFETNGEIDVPMLISRRQNIFPKLDKRNFTNIILMFDYDHHDTSFTDEKIKRMQEHFNSISEDGILYINYPMIESYQHIFSLPDLEFLNRQISVTCTPGSKYKNIVHKESVFWRYHEFYRKLKRCLVREFPYVTEDELEDVISRLLAINDKSILSDQVERILGECFSGADYRTIKFMVAHQIQELDYLADRVDFFSRIRQIFLYTALQNILKAWKVQNGTYIEGEKTVKEMYLEMDYLKILEQQNIASKDPIHGVIWVLCTCITFLGEYKFFGEDIVS